MLYSIIQYALNLYKRVEALPNTLHIQRSAGKATLLASLLTLLTRVAPRFLSLSLSLSLAFYFSLSHSSLPSLLPTLLSSTIYSYKLNFQLKQISQNTFQYQMPPADSPCRASSCFSASLSSSLKVRTLPRGSVAATEMERGREREVQGRYRN